MIGSFASGTTASLVAKNGTKKTYSTTVDRIVTSRNILLFEVSKWPSWHEYYYRAKENWFGLVGLPVAAILDIQMSISQPFKELQGWNLEFKLITPKSISGTYFNTVVAILDFSKGYILAVWRAIGLKIES